MVKTEYQLEHSVEKLLNEVKNESKDEISKVKITVHGNWEAVSTQVEDIVLKAARKHKLIIEDVSILADETWSNIRIKVLNKKNKTNEEIIKCNKTLSKTLNKAIIMLDDYNNMYGDQPNWNKTREINKLDQILVEAHN